MIITFSGASGTGKTTIAKALIERLPHAKPLRSVTTREPRATDLPGDFLHVTPSDFAAMEQQREFLWTAQVGETRYGTRREDLQNALQDDNTVWIMILVPTAVRNLRSAVAQEGRDPNAVIRSFFIQNPSDDVLRERLAARGDSDASIESRMAACANFETTARASGLPFIEIPDENNLDAKIQAVMSYIRLNDYQT